MTDQDRRIRHLQDAARRRRAARRRAVIGGLLVGAAAALAAALDLARAAKPSALVAPGAVMTTSAVSWQARWRRATDDSASPFIAPLRVAAGGGTVVVLDAGRSAVVAFDARSGADRWRRGRELGAREAAGGGADSATPIAVARDGRDGIFVLEAGPPRLVRLDAPSGRVRRVVPLHGVARPRGACRLADDSWLVVTEGGGDSAVVRLDATGRRLGRWAWPWPDIATGSPLLRQFLVVPSADGRECHALSLLDGRAARIGPDGRMTLWQLTGRSEAPPLRASRDSAGRRTERLARPSPVLLDAESFGDTLQVLAGGTSVLAGRRLDRYLVPPLGPPQLVESRRLPIRAVAMAKGAGPGAEVLLALRRGRLGVEAGSLGNPSGRR